MIDPNIKKKADDIRNKIYGKEVREGLASGLEEMSSDVVDTVSRQGNVESQFQDVIENTTDKDVISAPEIIAARNGESNLKARLDKENQEVTAQLAQTKRQVGVSIEDFPRLAVEVSDSGRIQRALDSIATTDHTEGVPENTVSGTLKMEVGKYVVTQSIKILSNIKIEGAGKNSTVLVSEITNGDPVLHVIGGDRHGNTQFFHNSFEEFTIFGQYNDCVGIRMDNTSRWSTKNVMITETNNTGMYLWESYLGEQTGLLVRACGDENNSSVVHDGRDANNGTHAITYTGGEIVGSPIEVKTIKAGLEIKKGMSNSLFGTTIESFYGGYGIIDNGVATTIQSCYFEFNKGNILANSEGSNYVANFMTLTEETAKGFIVIQEFNGGRITGNLFKESAPKLTHISAYDDNSYLRYSLIEGNTVTGFPLKIDEKLKYKDLGNLITSFDGSFDVVTIGKQTFTEQLTLLNRLYLGEGKTDFIEKNADGSFRLSTSTLFQFLKEVFVPNIRFYGKDPNDTLALSIFTDINDNKLKFKDSNNVVKEVEFLGPKQQVTFGFSTSTKTQANSFFVDSADGLLKFKDQFGSIKTVNLS